MFRSMKMIKLFDAELTVMQYLWENGPSLAAKMSEDMLAKYGWKKSSTYIVLKRLEAKGTLRRESPKYTVVPLITREQVQIAETTTLLDKMLDGNFTNLFANFLSSDQVSDSTLKELQDMIEQKKNKK